MLICVCTGFASGLPFFLLINLIPAWLRGDGVDLTVVGAFALIQLPYTWKFVWSPLVDRYGLAAFGRRRTWMLLTQTALLLGIAALGWLSPRTSLRAVVVLTTIVAIFSATQDIALDAYRRELLPDRELGLGNALHVNAYRIAGLVPGSLALVLADTLPWNAVFAITALFMLPGIVTTLAVREPDRGSTPSTLAAAVMDPFHEFLAREGGTRMLVILAFVVLYKLGDYMCTALATPFYLDMGYSRTQIGLVAKNALLWPSVLGGIVGGMSMHTIGINRGLWIFGFVQLASLVGYAWLAAIGPQSDIHAAALVRLASVIGLESLGLGLSAAAFVAFLARTTHPAYAATQYALLTSISSVPRTLIASAAGWLAQTLGWVNFYLLCVALAVPGLLLLIQVAPWKDEGLSRKPEGYPRV